MTTITSLMLTACNKKDLTNYHLKSELQKVQKVQYSNVSGIQMVGIQIPPYLLKC